MISKKALCNWEELQLDTWNLYWYRLKKIFSYCLLLPFVLLLTHDKYEQLYSDYHSESYVFILIFNTGLWGLWERVICFWWNIFLMDLLDLDLGREINIILRKEYNIKKDILHKEYTCLLSTPFFIPRLGCGKPRSWVDMITNHMPRGMIHHQEPLT